MSETETYSASKADDISAFVKEQIADGRWGPGERINDATVAEELSVSRLSVREALSKLVENRLLERVRWKGFFVREVTVEEIESIVAIRTSLEKLAMSELMNDLSEDTINHLCRAIDSSESTLTEGSHAEYMKADFEFHQVIYEKCGNPWIPVIIENLHVFLNIGRNISMGADFSAAAAASIADHREMLALMKNGDREGLMSAFDRHMQTHLENIKRERTHL